MKIVVVDIAASKTGALAILMDFYEYVRENGRDHQWIFLTGVDCIKDPPPFITVKVMDRVKRSQKDRLVFDFFTGRGFIEDLEPDVIFSMQNTLTFGSIRRRKDLTIGGQLVSRRGDKVPQVLYVHQPLGYQKTKGFSFFIREEREYAVYQYLIGTLIDLSVKRSGLSIVQTEWMREAVSKKTGKSLSKVVKVSPEVPDMSENRLRFVEGRPENWDKKHFFFPSGEILYKNHECVLKAAAILNEKGYTDFEVHFTLKSLKDVTDRDYPDPCGNIHWTGRVSREEVIDEYKRGTLLFPSYIETYGVPLAEARGVGTLILASDCPFSREVLKGYKNARFFDPFDPAELARLMESVLKGELEPEETSEETNSPEERGYGEILRLITSEDRWKS
ncbi:MAG: glycosyltransferase [Lachnospiraceae bacterium]|nr:glycosyltransferase [Lachnospiraceae bacterium]